MNIPTVTVDDTSPTAPSRCVHCLRVLGSVHTAECVRVQREVTIHVTMTLPVRIPASWTPEDIEFYFNESSWCLDNMKDLLQAWWTQLDQRDECLCPHVTCTYLREGPGVGLLSVNT